MSTADARKSQMETLMPSRSNQSVGSEYAFYRRRLPTSILQRARKRLDGNQKQRANVTRTSLNSLPVRPPETSHRLSTNDTSQGSMMINRINDAKKQIQLKSMINLQ